MANEISLDSEANKSNYNPINPTAQWHHSSFSYLYHASFNHFTSNVLFKAHCDGFNIYHPTKTISCSVCNTNLSMKHLIWECSATAQLQVKLQHDLQQTLDGIGAPALFWDCKPQNQRRFCIGIRCRYYVQALKDKNEEDISFKRTSHLAKETIHACQIRIATFIYSVIAQFKHLKTN